VVTKQSVAAADIGRAFAELVKGDSAISSIWVRQHRDVCEVWVLTAEIDADQERGLYAASGTLHDIFPNALMRFHLINPLHYEPPIEEAVHEVLPQDADPVPFPLR
jgi:hypothetical protein